MKSVKRKLSLVMMVALLFSAMCIPVSAAELPEEDVSAKDTVVEVVVLSDDDIMPASSAGCARETVCQGLFPYVASRGHIFRSAVGHGAIFGTGNGCAAHVQLFRQTGM